MNHKFFIPSEYLLTDLIPKHLQENNPLFDDILSLCQLYASSRQANKELNHCFVAFKKVNFRNISFA